MSKYADKAIVCTQAYNASATIRRAMDSVLNQTKRDIEYYILDNGSTDDTLDIIIEYAKQDKRVKPCRMAVNDIGNGGVLFTAIIEATNAQWAFWCDADDEYKPDFFERLASFATENRLDIAACGYEMKDPDSNEITKLRCLDSNLLVHGSAFTEKFTDYRGFMGTTWGKLFSVGFMRRYCTSISSKKYAYFSESSWLLGLFKKAKRIGIYAKPMYLWYQYPNSLSHIDIDKNLWSYDEIWNNTKDYLESYGKISKLNKDFLYAIYLSFIEEMTDKIVNSTHTNANKLDMLGGIFEKPIAHETFSRVADPQFRNLAARKEYIENVRKHVLAIDAGQYRRDGVLGVLDCLESCIP
jgi:glycosyltransferase involved in cell wall biosynthesis